MECEACDCTRSIKLPGKPLVDELGFGREEAEPQNDNFVDMGRIKLNRKKQKEGIQGLKNILNMSSGNENSIKPVFAGAAVSGLFAIFCDYKDKDYFRIKNIPDTVEARQVLKSIGLDVDYDVDSVKASALTSLAKSDKRSNIA